MVLKLTLPPTATVGLAGDTVTVAAYAVMVRLLVMVRPAAETVSVFCPAGAVTVQLKIAWPDESVTPPGVTGLHVAPVIDRMTPDEPMLPRARVAFTRKGKPT